MKRKIIATIILSLSVYTLMFIITIIAFLCLKYNKSLKNTNDKYIEEINKLDKENTVLNAKLAEFNATKSYYLDEISELKLNNKKLTILSNLNECPMCGRRDSITITSDTTTTTVSCNYCYTKVDFDEPIEIVSENKVKSIWNGLRIKPIK